MPLDLLYITFPSVRGDVLALVVVVLDIIAIVSVLAGRGGPLHKLFWIFLVLLLPVLGMILYFIFGRGPVDI